MTSKEIEGKPGEGQGMETMGEWCFRKEGVFRLRKMRDGKYLLGLLT